MANLYDRAAVPASVHLATVEQLENQQFGDAIHEIGIASPHFKKVSMPHDARCDTAHREV
jgi:hypothetical protein